MTIQDLLVQHAEIFKAGFQSTVHVGDLRACSWRGLSQKGAGGRRWLVLELALKRAWLLAGGARHGRAGCQEAQAGALLR
jgi:hypothetical protein